MKCSSSTLHLNVSKLLPSFNHYKNLSLDFEKIGNVLGHLKTTRGNLKQFSQMLWIVLVTFIFSRSRDIFTAVFCLLDTLMSGILILEHVKRPKITANKKDKNYYHSLKDWCSEETLSQQKQRATIVRIDNFLTKSSLVKYNLRCNKSLLLYLMICFFNLFFEDIWVNL